LIRTVFFFLSVIVAMVHSTRSA